jgi:hypothetical protein
LPIHLYRGKGAEEIRGMRRSKDGYNLIVIDGTDMDAFEATLRHELAHVIYTSYADQQ